MVRVTVGREQRCAAEGAFWALAVNSQCAVIRRWSITASRPARALPRRVPATVGQRHMFHTCSMSNDLPFTIHLSSHRRCAVAAAHCVPVFYRPLTKKLHLEALSCPVYAAELEEGAPSLRKIGLYPSLVHLLTVQPIVVAGEVEEGPPSQLPPSGQAAAKARALSRLCLYCLLIQLLLTRTTTPLAPLQLQASWRRAHPRSCPPAVQPPPRPKRWPACAAWRPTLPSAGSSSSRAAGWRLTWCRSWRRTGRRLQGAQSASHDYGLPSSLRCVLACGCCQVSSTERSLI